MIINIDEEIRLIGAGKGCNWLCEILKTCGFNNIKIYDSDTAKTETNLCGYTVNSIDKLDVENDSKWCITPTNETYFELREICLERISLSKEAEIKYLERGLISK